MSSSEGKKTWFDTPLLFLCTVFIQNQGSVPSVWGTLRVTLICTYIESQYTQHGWVAPLLSSLFLGTFQDNLLSCEEDLQNGAKNIIIQNSQGHHLWGKC